MSKPLTGRAQWPIVTAVVTAAVLGALGEYRLGYADGAPSHPPGPAAHPHPSRSRSEARPLAPPAGPAGQAQGQPPEVPEAGTGEFALAGGTGERIGAGQTLIRFQVAVELVQPAPAAGGTQAVNQPVEPAQFAAAVERTLADRRGWTASGTWSFVRVSDAPELVIRLTTPQTTDQRCAEYGLTTAGEVSCRGGDEIMINLRRWLLAVPWYAEALADYRSMVINHEIGHFLGFDHATCQGPGELAPVMQAQTYGLAECLRNPWPYPDPG